MRYLRPVRPGRPLVARAELVANRRGRVFEAAGELKDADGTLLATASGKYMPLRDADAAEMAGDFVGELGSVIDIVRDPGC